jgi:hypothetical protein
MSNPSVEITIAGPAYEQVAATVTAGSDTYSASDIKENVINAVGFAVNDVILTNIASQAVAAYEEIVAKLAEKGCDVEVLYRHVALLAVIILLVEWLLAIKSFFCDNVRDFVCDLPIKIQSLFEHCEWVCSTSCI